jgi:hypothetical protein
MDDQTTPTGPVGPDQGQEGGGLPTPEWAQTPPQPSWSAGEPPAAPPPPDAGAYYQPAPVPPPQKRSGSTTVVIVVVVVGLILCCCISLFGLVWSGVLGDVGDLGGLSSGVSPGSATYEEVSGPTGQAGTPAVWLSWDGGADMDLELWDSSGEQFLATAHSIEGDDATTGGQDEYFEFKDYGSDGDYGSGSYVVSAYFFGGDESDTEVTITVQAADGSVETYTQTLQYLPPYDQWHAFRIDAATGETQVVDTFYEGVAGG